MLSGLCAGLSGGLLGLTLQSARPMVGTGYEFSAITAVVVGGISIMGGAGSIPRAIAGLIFVQFLTNIMVLGGIRTPVQGFILGLLIIIAVALDVALRRRGGCVMRWIGLLMRQRVAIILGLTLVIAAATVPGFASLTTLSLGIDRGAAMGIVAVGLTVLLIAGKIDLSVGSTFALSGIVAVQLQHELGLWPGAVAGVLAGMLCGAVNGFATVHLKVNALVATLATMLMFRAIAHWLTDSQPLASGHIMFSIELSRVYLDLFTARSALFILLVLTLHLWLARTVWGRNLYAVGSNSEAGEASGLPVDRIVFLGSVFAGGMAGIAGVLQALATNTGSPVFGAEMTVAVIAAVVVGGTRIEGRRGSALGTLGGVLTIAAMTTAMEFQSVPAYVQKIVAGLILILIVVLDRNVTATTRKTLPAQPAQ